MFGEKRKARRITVTKSIPELKEELAAKQSQALIAIFDAQKESANVELGFEEPEGLALSREQMGRLWANQRADYVREARDQAKAEYLAAEQEFAEKQRERVAEIHRRLFAASAEASPDTLLKLAQASAETLGTMLTLALESSNAAAARMVLHAAHTRDDAESILIRWEQEVEGGSEDLEMLSELRQALDDEQIEARLAGDQFERVAPPEKRWADFMPTPQTPILRK
jgi:hypothetical protein